MAKQIKRKLSAFPCTAAHTQDAESDDLLFEFDAPKHADLTSLIQNPPYSSDILNVSINTKNRDDYWFTYSHYLHEEEKDDVDLTKANKRSSSIHSRTQVNKQSDTNHPKAVIPDKTMKPETKKLENPPHQEEKDKKSIKQGQNDLLKSNKKRFTINTSKMQDFTFASTKNFLHDKNEPSNTVKGHLQKRVLNVVHDDHSHQGKREQNQVTSTNVIEKKNLKRKGATSTCEVTNGIIPVQIKQNETLKNSLVNNNLENMVRPEPILKRLKPNVSPNKEEKKVERVKIEIKALRTPVANNKSCNTSFSSHTKDNETGVQTKKYQNTIKEKDTRRENLRRSVSAAPPRLPTTSGNTSKGKPNPYNPGKSQERIEVKCTKTQPNKDIGLHINEEKETSNSLKMLYEPPKYSAREVRKWEKISGKSWYTLSFHERHQANLEMEKMIKECKKG